jgi:putative hydrolase of the HAD superfamily
VYRLPTRPSTYFSPVPSILLLDLDHTLYPSTAPTLTAVDSRITTFIETRLGLTPEAADLMRRTLCKEHGTTLRGLELLHGVSRNEYTDFIQDLGDHLMPEPDPQVRDWLITTAAHTPTYIFTNARRDWADRCLRHIGIHDLVDGYDSKQESGGDAGLRVFSGIFDIDFMEWEGKPNRAAYTKVEDHVFARHPEDSTLIFADDRLENLVTARMRGWQTVWVRPHDAPVGLGQGHHIVDNIIDLDVVAF